MGASETRVTMRGRRGLHQRGLALVAIFAPAALSASLLVSPLAAAAGGTACGSRGMATCGADEFCDYAPAAMCGAADHPGTCRKRPQICTREFVPVCGCGDVTYPNDCERRAAGVGKLHDGACK